MFKIRVPVLVTLTIGQPSSPQFYDDTGREMTEDTHTWLYNLHEELLKLSVNGLENGPANIVQVRSGTSERGRPAFVYGHNTYPSYGESYRETLRYGVEEFEDDDMEHLNETEQSGPWVFSITIQQIRDKDANKVEHFYFNDFSDQTKLQLRLLKLMQHLIR